MSKNRDNPTPVGRVPSHGAAGVQGRDAASGAAVHNNPSAADVGRLPPAGASLPATGVPPPARAQDQPPARRLRRLHRIWPDHEGNISFLLTLCVDGRAGVLDNEDTFQRLVDFLLDSPQRYRWFGRRFVVMPDHLHLIAHQGFDAVRLGQWIKALKAVVGGLKRREEGSMARPAAALGNTACSQAATTNVGRLSPAGADAGPLPPAGGDVGRVPPHGVPSHGKTLHEFTRLPRSWRWQAGFHDHKFRTAESETRKWEYVCLNPVRYGLVQRPEQWPYGGEIFYDEPGGPRLVRGTPPLLETGMLIEEETSSEGGTKPREGTRPTT